MKAEDSSRPTLELTARPTLQRRTRRSSQRDPRMLPSLITALDDSDVSVRGLWRGALGKLGDRASIEALTRRKEVEGSIYVRASLQQALDKLGE